MAGLSRDPRVDAYIAARQPFAPPILNHLRELVHKHAPGVEETLKWGVPHFVLNGQNLAGMAAFFDVNNIVKLANAGMSFGSFLFGGITDIFS